MSVNMDVDDSESQYYQGYLRGISTTIETREHIGPAVSYAYKILKNHFYVDADQMARLHKDNWYHVYEWGDSWATRKDNAGIPDKRLWKLVSTGDGANRSVGFTFLPSVKPTPLHPEEIKVGVEQRHTFTWKAPVMEAGETVTIAPVDALHGRLVFFWEKKNKLVSTAKTITTKIDTAVVGVFSGFFIEWWRTDANIIFNKEIRPIFERDIVKNVVIPRNNGRFAKGRSKTASRALMGGQLGAKYKVTIDMASQEEGYKDAVKTMSRITAGYAAGAGGEKNYRGDN